MALKGKRYYGEDQSSFFELSEKTLNLHGKKLQTTYISDKNGHDALLLQGILDWKSKTDLFTLVKTSNPEFYEPFGFELVIASNVYNMASSIVPEFKVDGIVLDPKSQDLLNIYQTFTQHFTGFFERNIEHFDSMKKNNKDIQFVGFSENKKVIGYLRYQKHSSHVEILEACYDKSGTLLRMISYVSRGVSRIVLHTSSAEHLQKLFIGVKPQRLPFIMARVNDKALFERLYHIKIISAYSAFNAFGKPLFNRDYE